MNEDEVIRVLHEHFENLFPKICPNCNHCFRSLREYIRITRRLAPAISFDAELNNWDTTLPIGSMALAACACGTTLALSTMSMELPLRLELLNWLKNETRRRGVTSSELLEYLRERVRHRAESPER